MTGASNPVTVTLISRAKIAGKWRHPGAVLPVDPNVALELQLAGAIAPIGAATQLFSPRAPTDSEIAAIAQTMADAAVKAAVETATAELKADCETYRIRAEGAEADNRTLQAQVYEFEAKIASLEEAAKEAAGGDAANAETATGTAGAAEPAPAKSDTQNTSAAKTAPKKGAAAKS